ncbi:MAG TPA: NHLP bacteriocin export ABC transporter permease/ATPase subunit [Bacillales bacterium]|nr:NHLP bacteriocin export ABC transporter permease/ATPase subunit [Bacillales bacterium]
MNLSSLSEFGEIIDVSGKYSRALYGANHVWIVLEGAAELFAVDIESGHPQGRKQHVMTLSQGKLFFTFEHERKLGFFINGHIGTQLLRVEWDTWMDLMTRPNFKDSLLHLAEEWVQSVLKVLPDEERLSVTATGDILIKENGGLEEMRNLQSVLLDFLENRQKEEQFRERKHIEEKSKKDRNVLNDSLHNMASILQPDKNTVDAVNTDDLLLFAMQAIGKNLGVTVNPPTESPDARDDERLKQIMRNTGMRKRRVLLQGNWWEVDQGPLLAYFEENDHPVALIPKNASSYEYVDLQSHAKYKVTPEIADQLVPLAYTFYAPFPNKKLNVFDLLKFGTRFTWKRDIVFIVLLGVAAGLLGMLTPIMTGFLYNNVIPQSSHTQLFYLGLALIVSVFAAFLFSLTQSIAMVRMEGRMSATVQAAVWDRVLSLPVRFFRDYTAGDLSERIQGISSIRQLLSGATLSTILSSTFSLFNIILLFFYDANMAFAAIGLILLSVMVSIGLGLLKIRQNAALLYIQGKLSGILFQLIQGIAKFRVAGAENRAFHLWVKPYIEQQKKTVFVGKIDIASAVFNIGFSLVSSMVLFYMMMSHPQMGTGTFLAFLAAFTSSLTAILAMSTSALSILEIIPLYQRSKPILQAIPEHHDEQTEIGQIKGEVEVNHAYFRYSPEAPYVLEDVSLQVNPGEFVAVVGSSGSGKSTLFRLLLGFDTPERGGVYYDRQDLSEVDIRSVREQIGVVLQNDQVMAGSIFDNIIGSANLTLEDAWEAAEMAGFADDIKEMPMGMHTVLSEGASTLSGGQRQRLMIARALVRKPRILLFDEATSALDNRTQAIVSESLERLKVTRIVIAHRLSTIIHADRIYVIEKGKVVEGGTYEELMAYNGVLAALAKRQLA